MPIFVGFYAKIIRNSALYLHFATSRDEDEYFSTRPGYREKNCITFKIPNSDAFMPLNKEALIRYRVINRCLVNKRYVSRDRLIQACEEALDIAPIGRRTIEQDIHDMREDGRLGYYAPIRFNKEKEGYYYEDPGYSIDSIPINEIDLEALAFIATMLDHYKNIDIFSTFSGAVQKIVDAINIRRVLDENPSYPFVEFEKAPFYKGSEYLEPLLRAIREEKVVVFDYQRFDSEKAYRHKVHPYLLKEYRNRWYLVGLNHDLEEIRTYGLDRIVILEKELCDIPFRKADFDPRIYFHSTVGIIVPHTEPMHVVLKFTHTQGQYVITQPIHETQRLVEETKDHVIISLDVCPTYEFISMILGWGAAVEVMEPGKLRKKIIDLYKHCLGVYNISEGH